VLVDTSELLSPESIQLLENTNGKNRIIVGTKCDMKRVNTSLFVPDIFISATIDINIDGLKSMLVSMVEDLLPKDNADAAILTGRQLHECLECIKELSSISVTQGADIQAHHLRRAVQALDRSRGVLVEEEILDDIFSRFCIGK